MSAALVSGATGVTPGLPPSRGSASGHASGRSERDTRNLSRWLRSFITMTVVTQSTVAGRSTAAPRAVPRSPMPDLRAKQQVADRPALAFLLCVAAHGAEGVSRGSLAEEGWPTRSV